MKTYSIKSILIAALFSVAIVACNDDDKDAASTNADQAAFLENTGTIIFINYQQFNADVNDLALAIDSLEANTSQVNLAEAKAALKTAYTSWQKVSPFEFGPAEAVSLKSNLNIYKTDTAQIESNISSANYNFDQISMKDAIGFPALDYLLNSKSNDISKLNSNPNRMAYIQAVSAALKTKANEVATAWISYQNTYKTQEGTDVGSSTGMLINALNQHFEKFFRDNKIGIPLGIRSSGIARTDYVEAPYGNYSMELAKENLATMKAIYTGNDGYGIDDYLNDSDAEDLNQSITNQISIIELKLGALSDPLQSQIETNSAQVQEAYSEMQNLIVLLKVDLPSRLGVLITYQDNDGD